MFSLRCQHLVHFWAVISLGYWVLLPPSLAQEASNEYKIKAGYLYNFTKFIAWPADSSPTFNLCILAADPFGGLIDPIEKRSVEQRSIKVFRLADVNRLVKDKSLVCHILFTPAASPPKNLPANTLTVGEREHFAKDGGMIEFMNQDSHIKLLINLAAVKQSELKVSAKLLEVADLVAEARP